MGLIITIIKTLPAQLKKSYNYLCWNGSNPQHKVGG